MGEKVKELKEKYSDVINNLLVKYGGTTDRGFDYFTAMVRGWIYGGDVLYETDLAVDKEEIIKDYIDYLGKAEEVAKEKGLID